MTPFSLNEKIRITFWAIAMHMINLIKKINLAALITSIFMCWLIGNGNELMPLPWIMFVPILYIMIVAADKFNESLKP